MDDSGPYAQAGEAPALVGAEPMQVVKYTQGEMYTAHYDNKVGRCRLKPVFDS